MVENKIAVDRNHAALKRILASLVAMAGWTATGGTFLRACGDAGGASILPRHLYVAILRLLRPAEAATRRLVIVLARGISVTLPPLRPAKPKPGPVLLKDGKGTGIVDTGISLYRLGLANVDRRPLRKSAPLLRPARSPSRCSIRCAIRSPAAAPGQAEHRRAPLPARPHRAACHSGRRLPSPHDPIDATRLGQRLAALASALDDMPAQALRFARWRAHRDRMRGQPPSPGRFRRIWPLRPGRPPGGRLSRFDPVARRLSRDPRGGRGSGARPCDGPLCPGEPASRHLMTAHRCGFRRQLAVVPPARSIRAVPRSRGHQTGCLQRPWRVDKTRHAPAHFLPNLSASTRHMRPRTDASPCRFGEQL